METFWTKPHWENSDPHLVKLKEAPFQRAFPTLTLSQGIYIVRGPRQVGKTTWLKHLLLDAIQTSQKKCFYLSCEKIRDYTELGEILKSLRGYHLVLLDEVSFIKDWARAVKYEADGGHLTTLVLTGSNAHELRTGAERLPGRLGQGKEIELLPMDFQEFCEMRKQAGWKPLNHTDALELYFRVGRFSYRCDRGRRGRARAYTIKGDLSEVAHR